MDSPKALNKTRINMYLCLLSLIAVAAVFYAVVDISKESLDAKFFILASIAVFFSSYVRIQLPRTKIYLSFSEVIVIYIFLTYGSGGAIIIAALEAWVVTYNFKRQGVTIKNRTILMNGVVGANSMFFTALTIHALFPRLINSINQISLGEFAFVMLATGVILFLYNSISVSIWFSLKVENSAKAFWETWFNYCVNALVIYIAAALLAGLAIKSQNQFSTPLILLAVGVFAIVYFTYRRYVDDVKETSAKAEQAERKRAEEAEKHVVELEHHIAEQDRISLALRESKERFRHAAFHDELTDLPNRSLFMQTLKSALEQSKQNPDYKFAVLFLDINRFKNINDSLGHSTGDRLIQQVAKRLETSVRGENLVARFGGDEFAFILTDIVDVKDAVSFAEHITDKISAPFTLRGRQIFTSFSIGISLGNADYQVAEDILRDADIAMYHAKESNNDWTVFDPKMHTRTLSLLQLETDLRSAIERDELCMYYQPIIDLDSLKLGGFESLVRWNHPTRGLVPPNEFIPVSEETGLIIPMTLWILRTSCRQLVEWQLKYPETSNLMVSVNLSGKHFAQKDLVKQIAKIIDETQINPACLKLELTESAVMENAESVISMLEEIRKLGIHLSIDDFGTGYSSLSYLHRFPINTLKVDRSFVGAMEEGSENGEIVRTIVSLAKTLNLDVIAEGIETVHQLEHLRFLGCEYGQGYLFSRPVPSEEAEKILNDESRWENILPEQSHIMPNRHGKFSHLRLAK